jgi:threonine/homoserine/homoserine lactone efflux protein
MPSSATLGVFIAATVTLILIPGPATFYILGRGLTAGRRIAFAAALGIEYLPFLAVRALRAGAPPASAFGGTARYGAACRQGFLVGASNPKVALFFLAFLPQFVDPDRGAAATQVLLLGTIFVALGLAADTLNAYLSGFIGRVLEARPAFLGSRARVEVASYFGLAGWSLASGAGTTRN